MRAASLRAGLLALGLAGCAARAGVAPPPPWDERGGRDQTRLLLAGALVDAGSPEGALQVLGALRAEGMDGVEIDLVQARALRAAGLLDDAAVLLQRVVDAEPRNGEAWRELGVLRMDAGAVGEAVRAFEAATRSDPRSAAAWNNLGFARLSAGDAPGAVEALRAALERDPSDRRTRNNLGFALVAAGQTAEALRAFTAAGDAASAQYNLGVALELRGDPVAARAAYTESLRLRPADRRAAEALARLSAPSEVSPP
jgi:Flp pilus assembly protein TadD